MGRRPLLSLAVAVAASAAAAGPSAPPFGHALLPLFALSPNYTNLNHGSYGAVPRSVTANASAWDAVVEANPDAWYRYNMWAALDAARARVAAYVGADPADVAFVDNASSGVNAVLRSLARVAPPGATFLTLNTAYFMVRAALSYLEPAAAAHVVANVTQPVTPGGVVAAVTAALDAAPPGSIYAASFSHITSLPGAILPVAELAALCASRGVLVLVDGAHALGQVPVNLTALGQAGVDFWVGNGHKWLYSPKGSAALWVRRDRQSLIEPTVISWEGQGATHFQAAFAYTGTASYSAYLAMAAALDFRDALGGDAAILPYVHGLAAAGGAALAAAWGTDVLFAGDDTAYGAMVDVRVPTTNATTAAALPAALLARFGTWVPVYDIGSVGGPHGVFYTRVSAQVYLELSDFGMLAAAVATIIGDAEGRPVGPAAG